MDPDLFRIITIFLTVVAMSVLPWSLQAVTRPARVWFLIIGVEVWAFGRLVAIGESWGDPIEWWRTPLAFVASASIIIYAMCVVRARTVLPKVRA